MALSVAAWLALVIALSSRRRDWFTPVVSAGGAVLVLGGRFQLDSPAITGAGAALLVVAAIVDATRCRRAQRK